MATKRDFITVSNSIKANMDKARGEMSVDGFKAYFALTMELADNMADKYQNDNPRFDRQRFMSACGF